MGRLSSQPSASAHIFWVPFLYEYPAVLLWTILGVLLLTAGVRRQPPLVLVLIPAIILQLALLLIMIFGHFGPSTSVIVSQVFTPLIVGLAALCLVIRPPAGGSRGSTFLKAGGVLVASGILSLLAYNVGGNEIGRTGKMGFIFYLILGGAILVGAVLAGCLSHDRHLRQAFVARLLAWVFVLAVLAILVYGWHDVRPRSMRAFTEIVSVGLVFGVCACGVALPFALLWCYIPFFQARLRRCFYRPLPVDLGEAGLAPTTDPSGPQANG